MSSAPQGPPPSGPPPSGPPPSGPPPSGPPPGFPPQLPAPRGSRKGLITLVIGLLVLVVAAVVVIVLLVTGDDSDDSDRPDGDDGRSDTSSDGSSESSSGSTAGGSDEDQIREVAVESITRWARAEGGDASACVGIDDLFAVDEDGDGSNESAEEQCRSEVGSNQDATVDSAEATDVEIDGDTATVQVELKGSSAEDGDIDTTQEISLVKQDGTWRVTVD